MEGVCWIRNGLSWLSNWTLIGVKTGKTSLGGVKTMVKSRVLWSWVLEASVWDQNQNWHQSLHCSDCDRLLG